MSKEVRTLRYLSLMVPLKKAGDEAIHKELGDTMERAATTASSLEAKQESGAKDTMLGDADAQTRVKKLEKKVKSNKARRRARIVFSEDEDVEEDSSKQRRKISKIDKHATISLVQPEQDMEYDFDDYTANRFTTASVPVTTARIKISIANILVNTAGATVTTASASISTVSPLRVSTAKDISGAETLVYIRKSASKDKGKAIIQESEPPKKIKMKEMIQIGHDEELTQKLHAEELVKDTTRQEQERYDFEKALELQKQLNQRENVAAKSQAHDIDWNDHAVLRYHAVQNRSFSKAKDSEIEKKVIKRSGFDFQQESSKQVEEEVVQQDNVVAEKIHRADGSYKTYIFFCEMLNDFDRKDLIVLYRLFNEKYASTRPGIDDLMLLRDMKIMFELDDDDAVWKNHHSQELIEWKLYDSCGVHSLMLGEVSIYMLVEKKYPLPHDTLTRMIQWKLHVNYDVTEMAYEHLRFIRSQLNQ
ncbi:hypothetical protein Tco_0568269 [Tanacetum coccineum]